MMTLFTVSSIISALFFLSMKNPLSMGVLLIINTFTFSLLTGMMTNHFWFFYILILVFIGGMLVLFIYATSIFPNEKFLFNQTLMYNLMAVTLFFLALLLMMNTFFNFTMLMNNLETNFSMILNLKTIFTEKIFASNSSVLYLFLVNYLFYCMIIVIKITNFFYGPLRKMI